MDNISYPRHFAALILIVVLWIVYSLATKATIFDDGFMQFAAVGAFHALTVVAALTGQVSILKKASFVVGAMVLASLATVVGLLVYSFLPLRESTGPYVVFAMASFAGALMYAFLVKALLAAQLQRSVFLTASILCPLATIVAMAFQQYSNLLHESFGVTVAWWLAFSTSLLVSRGTSAANHTVERTLARAARAPHRER